MEKVAGIDISQWDTFSLDDLSEYAGYIRREAQGEARTPSLGVTPLMPPVQTRTPIQYPAPDPKARVVEQESWFNLLLDHPIGGPVTAIVALSLFPVWFALAIICCLWTLIKE
jgi:hypothetical protein